MTPSRSRDNFTALPAFLLGTLAIAMMLPGAWNTFGTSLLLILVAVIGSLVSLLVNLALWRWRRVLSVVAGLIVAVALVVSAQQLELGSRIRLLANKEFYMGEIANDPVSDGEPRFRLFDWGDFGGAGVANTFLTLIFDESGELARPPNERSEQWKQRVAKATRGSRQSALLGLQVERRTVDITQIDGPFYVVRETYQ
jgi:hypothetical protein